MGKKGTKKKTTWRTLSISETVAENVATSRKNGSFSSEQNRQPIASIKDDRFINSSYLRRKPLYNSLSNNDNNNHRTEFSRNYYKQNSALSTTSSTSTTTYSSRQSSSYYRRSYQNSATRFFNFRSGRSNNNNNNNNNYYNNYNNGTSHGNRTSETNKENNQTKPLFNEEEYTRITTPRQDVIFKKGYLSQPRKYLSSTDTNTTSSAAASIVSTEESFSATSVPSLSPEQCSSYADSIDPEQAAFMYSSYVDQNGVFYINPYMPNGFDQYTGQMFMLPYSYQPYNVYPSELNSPMPSTDVDENAVSTDSNNENTSDKETNIKEKSEEISISSCDSKPEEDQLSKSVETIVNPEKDEEKEKNEKTTAKENVEQTENMNTSFENFYNYGYQQFYPPVFFPYVYGQQFMPFMGTECEPFTVNENAVKYKRRDRTSTSVDGNSIGATNTDDCSDEDCNDDDIENDENTAVEKESCDTVIELKSENNQETEKKIIFNANAEEFIPRIRKSHLNVNVKEFLPNTSKLKEENDVTINSTSSLEEKEITPESDCNNSSNHKESKEILSMKNPSESNIKENAATTITSTLQQRNESEKPILTLAERIKIGLTESSANTSTPSNLEKSSPLKTNILAANNTNNNSNNNKKGSNLKRNNDIKKNLNDKSSISFAQILAKNNKKAKKSASSPNSTVVSNNNGYNNINNNANANANEKYSAKNTAKKINLNLDLQQQKVSAIDLQQKQQQQQQQSKISNIHKENTTIIAVEKVPIQDEWQTVKSKGKRKHFKEIIFTDEVEPGPEPGPGPESEQKECKTSKSNAEAQKSPIIKDTIIKEKAKCPEDDDEKKVVEPLVINNSSNEPSLEKGKKCEETSTTVDPIIDDHSTKLTELDNSQKRIKTRNKRSAKKGQNSVNKKIIAKDSDFNVMDTINRSNQKTEPKRKIYSKSDEESTSRKSLLFSHHNNNNHDNNNNNNDNSEDDELTLDGLYLVDRKNCLLAQNFCRNPLEILNGFDCKFKGSNNNNNSILKEEEEMVLNVIKSLSTNQLKQFETAKTANINTNQFENDITLNHEDIKTSFSLDNNKKFEEIKCNHHKSEINVKNSNENHSNGHTSDSSCELLSKNHIVDEDQEEIFGEDTIIQTLTERVDNSVNGKLMSDTESVSDLSSEDYEKATDTIVLKKVDTLTPNEEIVENALNGIFDISMEICENLAKSTDVECIQHENNSNNKLSESIEKEEEPENIDDININISSTITAQVSVETSNSCLNDEKIEEVSNQVKEAQSNLHLMDSEMKEKDTHPAESAVEKLEENIKENIKENICSFTDCELVQNLEESQNENNAIIEIPVQVSSKEIPEENFHSEKLLKDTSKDETFSVDDSSQKQNIFEHLCKVHDNSSKDQGSILPNNKLHQNEEIIKNLQLEESILVVTKNNEEIQTLQEDNFNIIDSYNNCCSNNENNCIYPQIQNDNVKVIEPLLISLEENLMENISNTERLLPSTISPPSITGSENLQVIVTSADNTNIQLENINTEDSSKLFSLTEIKDNSKETFIKQDNSYKLDYNDSMVTNNTEPPPPTITSEDIADNPKKFPLTTAIKEWLNNEVKENSPEQIFRIPEDPKLNSVIKNSLMIKGGYNKDNNNDDYEDDDNDDNDDDDDDDNDDDVTNNEVGKDVEDKNFTSDDSDHHNDKKNGKRKLNWTRKKSLKRSKNLKSNPSHVSSVKSKSLSISINKQIDEQQNMDNNDSDYNSDNQLRYDDDDDDDDDDDNTCERVATYDDNDVYETIIMTTEEIHKRTKCDLLDYWDDEFIRNPKKWLDDLRKNTISRCPSEDKESMLSSSTPPKTEQLLAPYESVYGKSIDYKRLLANNYEFLSNNIISFNNNNNNNDNDKSCPNDNNDDNDNNDIDNDQNDAVVNIKNASHFNDGGNNNNNNNNANNEENHIKRMSTNDNGIMFIKRRKNHHEHNNYNKQNHNHNLVINNNIKKNNNGNDNCLKPPEVCCIIM